MQQRDVINTYMSYFCIVLPMCNWKLSIKALSTRRQFSHIDIEMKISL